MIGRQRPQKKAAKTFFFAADFLQKVISHSAVAYSPAG
jgi:hypothetical protein